MLITFIFSYSEKFFVLFYLSFSLLLLVLPCLGGVFHHLVGCFLTETGLDQEGLESFLFLFPLDLKAVIAVVVRLTTMLTLKACLRFGDQCVGVQLSFVSSASFAFFFFLDLFLCQNLFLLCRPCLLSQKLLALQSSSGTGRGFR